MSPPSWRVLPLGELLERVRGRAQPGRVCVVAVDGHSSSGKTTLARRLAAALPDAAVLSTDDLARPEGVFAWDRPLLDDVLPVVRRGEPLDHPPPAWWRSRGIEGSVTLPGSLAYLLVEGVGAGRASVRDAYDLVLWVETEEPTRLTRDQARLAAGEMATPGAYESWMAEENAYTTAERPWEHAELLVYGGEWVAHDRDREIVLRHFTV